MNWQLFLSNEYYTALGLGFLIFSLWVLTFAIAEAWKYAWAWVDDYKPAKHNFLVKIVVKIMVSKWRYPVYNGEYYEGMKVFGYAKDKKFDKASVHCLKEGTDYLYDYKCNSTFIKFCKIISITTSFPLIILLCFKFYLTVSIVTIIFLIAHLTRFTRRFNKKYKQHVENKNIHVQTEED